MTCADGEKQWLHAAQMAVISVETGRGGAVEGLDQQGASCCSVHSARHGCELLVKFTTAQLSSTTGLSAADIMGFKWQADLDSWTASHGKALTPMPPPIMTAVEHSSQLRL